MAQTARNEADKAANNTKETADNVADLGKHAVADTAPNTVDRAGDAVRSGMQGVQRIAGAVTEVERAVARQSAAGAGELGQVFAELLGQQTRDGIEAFEALTGVVDWDAAARIQGEFLRSSMKHSAELVRRYFEVTQAVIGAAASATKNQSRKAA